MLTARLAGTCQKSGLFRLQLIPRKQFTSSPRQWNARAERIADRVGSRTTTKPTSLKEKLMAPAGNNAFGIGKGVVAGCSVLGLGALCVYGSGLGGGIGYREKSMMWPQYIKDRVKRTFLYFGGSVVVSAAVAVGVFRTPALLNIVAYQSWVGALVSVGVLIGSSMFCQSLPYQKGFGAKQIAWLVHSGVVGAVLAPMCFLGGPLLMRAATYTAGVAGGLTAIAVCAPSEKFLSWGAPLGMGLGLVAVSTLAGIFLPPTTVIGAGLYSVSMYGGLAIFSGLMLYDTQKALKRAEITAPNSQPPFDPINNSISIYMDAVNIFIRIAMMMATGGNRKK